MKTNMEILSTSVFPRVLLLALPLCGLCGSDKCSKPNPGSRDAARCDVRCNHSFRHGPMRGPDRHFG
jgi:hypothetical protein